MRRFIYIFIITFICGLLPSCHDLDVPVATQLTPETFPKTAEQFVLAGGPTYSQFRQEYAVAYWFLQTLSTDEAIMPARGGNWFDNGRYMQHHFHSWTPDNAHINGVWGYLSTTISISNQNMSLIESQEIVGGTPADEAGKVTSLAELRMMRAIAVYMMMDLWGNVPIPTFFGDLTPIVNKPRAEVFNWIESEVKASLPSLSSEVGVNTYGRPNKYTAHALLAKLYLNAPVYINTPKYNEAIAACDSIISSGKYAVESAYLEMFYPNNGPQIKEFIFAIPFDGATPNGYMFFARYHLPRSHRTKFGLPFVPSAPMSTLPEYYAYFDDPNDVRNKQWLTGKQYNNDGTPIIVNTTKKGFDEDYTGADGADKVAYHVELTPDVVIKKLSTFDAGNDEKSWYMGFRNNKFYPDNTSATRNQSNDVPVFRYSDILLMKAESILRGGAATLGHTPASLVNDVRSKRTTSPALSDVTLEDVYKERVKEFTNENWHRNDMIRFGKFEDKWGYKTDSDPNKRLFPIPTGAIQLNPGLIQNPGY
jgi:starch-binding outer membrane protein, SusD/RagB family